MLTEARLHPGVVGSSSKRPGTPVSRCPGLDRTVRWSVVATIRRTRTRLAPRQPYFSGVTVRKVKKVPRPDKTFKKFLVGPREILRKRTASVISHITAGGRGTVAGGGRASRRSGAVAGGGWPTAGGRGGGGRRWQAVVGAIGAVAGGGWGDRGGGRRWMAYCWRSGGGGRRWQAMAGGGWGDRGGGRRWQAYLLAVGGRWQAVAGDGRRWQAAVGEIGTVAGGGRASWRSGRWQTVAGLLPSVGGRWQAVTADQ